MSYSSPTVAALGLASWAALLSSAPALIVSMPAFPQDTPSRLRYAAPNDWTPSIDGRSLFPPGGNSAVTFTPSTTFAGTAQQWMTQSWNDVLHELTLVSEPVVGSQGAFLTRIGVFRQADGTNVWLCLNTLVQDGRGEAVIYVAADEARFRAHLQALGAMLDATTVPPLSGSAFAAAAGPASGPAPVTNPSASPARTPASNSGDTSVAGLYVATTRQLRLNPLGPPGSASWEVRTEFYLLSRDGRVFRGPDLPEAPDGDISRFDYEAARREATDAYGTYVTRGREVVLTMGERSRETIVATRLDPDVLEIRDTKYTRSAR